jgi:small subunit ribosomal protein S9
MSDEQEPDVTDDSPQQDAQPEGEAPAEGVQAAEPQADADAPEPQADADAPEPRADADAPEPRADADAPGDAPAGEDAPAGAQAPAAEEAAGGEEQSAGAARPGREAAGGEKPVVPGAHLEVDIVPEGADPLGREEAYADPYADEDEPAAPAASDDEDRDEALPQPIATAAIDLASGARYRATGKRKTAIARVMLRPGNGSYLVNGRPLEQHFPRETLQRNIRQPLETVGYEDRMDVVARLHGGGISAQAGALRHGVSRALLEADPNLRGELKRRGFLTRDSRAKERKKAGLKKARKRPQFSKR